MVPRQSRRPLAAAVAALLAAGAAILAISAGSVGAADEPDPRATDPSTSASASLSVTAEPTLTDPAPTVTGTTPTEPTEPTEPTSEPPPVDTTPPVITPTVTGASGIGGWYVGDVTVTWSVSDPDSAVTDVTGCEETAIRTDAVSLELTCSAASEGGPSSASVTINRDATAPVIVCPDATRVQGSIAALTVEVSDSASGPAAPTLTADVPTLALGPVSVAFSATDVAGNVGTASCTVTVAADATAPVIDPAVIDGPAGQNGWFVGDVTVTFPVSEPDSALLSATGCGPVVVTVDGPATPVTCTATSYGGTAAALATVARDTTPPVIACPPPPSIVQGSTRVLTAAVSDATSGPTVAAVSGPLPSLTLGAATIRLSSVDNAGIAGSADCGYVVVADPTAPIVTPQVQGDAGRTPSGALAQSANGAIWYRGPVTVSFSVTEDESVVLSQSGCGDTVVSADTPGQVITCTASSYGGDRPTSVIVAVDSTPPVVTCDSTPVYVQGSPGSVSATFSDATSGPVTLGSDVEVSTLALGLQSAPISAVDAAGNVATENCRFRVIEDISKPIIAVTIDGTTVTPGWYTGPVTVSFAVSDPDSPVTSLGCDTVTVNADTVAQVAAVCRATSYGGLATEQVVISRDSTGPTMTCLPLRFVQGAAGRATANVVDATSGVVAASVSRSADTSTPGVRSLKLTATDRAGNATSIRCEYDVVERKTVSATKLSSTGSDLAPMVLGGILLAVAGSALAVVARRRVVGSRRHGA